ncbi:hypothetical protein I2I05_18905 [Hymenobacter sp. BT683]|uniref:Major capsid protein n=1 Tax=Hymenobacter jeongseonensis TaxID=2791027 RepID=A0ABS0IM80_9BACT|nr:hypothetical protein [Hymenobacter jeongseonensis]MBF9239470.1 hypothetical protein [Hymenobacter jeongseonensis]
MAAIDFSGLPAKITSYTLREAQQLLSTILITDQSFLNYMGLLVDVVDEQALTQIFVSSVLQPGGKDTFDPKGTVGFKNRIGKVRSCKIDYTLTPTVINAMWKGYLGRINKSKRGDVYDVPFQQYIMDRMAEKGKEEMHLDAVFKAVYNPDKKQANRIFDGLLPLMSNAGVIAAANIFAGAPVTQANAIDQLEGLADKVPSHLINRDLVMLVEPTVAKFYNRDYRGTFGSNTNNTGGFVHTTIDGTNITITPEPGLADTGGMIVTPRENLVWLTGPLGGVPGSSFIVEKSKRNIDIMADFEAAPDFAIAEYVWCNDAALAKGVALRAAAAAE